MEQDFSQILSLMKHTISNRVYFHEVRAVYILININIAFMSSWLKKKKNTRDTATEINIILGVK